MKRAKLTPSAKADLVELFVYIANASQSVREAQRYMQKIRDYCNHLATLPFQMGIPRPDLAPGMRSVAFENYVILFRYTADRMEVINIIEGHRDMASHFSESNPE